MLKDNKKTFISLMLWFILISVGHAFTTVEVSKKALPAVVGIAVPKQLFSLYRFGEGEENQRIKEFLKEYGREVERFKKHAEPAQKSEKASSVKPEELQVVGSGFFIRKDGTVLTAAHVVEEANQVYVVTYEKKYYPAKVIRQDRERDLAVLQLEGKFPAPASLPLGDSKKLEVGEPILAVGNPFGFTFTVTSGIVSALDRQLKENGIGLIQTDAPINPGNSGGPILNLQGEVVGVSHAIVSPAQRGQQTFAGLSFAVPIAEARELLSRLK